MSKGVAAVTRTALYEIIGSGVGPLLVAHY
jgi:hypothetical protein